MITVGLDTYISLADARTYCSDNSLDSLPADDTEAETLLKRAAKTMDQIYSNQYIGQKRLSSTLKWPRDFAYAQPHFDGEYIWVVDSDGNPRDDLSGIPEELGYAQTEMAIKLQSDADSVYAQPEPALASERSKLDVMETEKTYKSSSGYVADTLYKIKLILRPLLVANSAAISITRGK